MPYIIRKPDSMDLVLHFNDEVTGQTFARIQVHKDILDNDRNPTAEFKQQVQCLILGRAPRFIPDIIHQQEVVAVSDEVRTLLEELKTPGLVFYEIPVKTIQKVHGRHDHGNYNLLIDIPRLDDFIDIARTEFLAGFGWNGYNARHSGGGLSYYSGNIVVDDDIVEGYHLWRPPPRSVKNTVMLAPGFPMNSGRPAKSVVSQVGSRRTLGRD